MFLVNENTMMADFAQEDLAEILAVAESEYADLTVEAVRAEAAIAISMATEADDEKKAGRLAGAKANLEKWGKAVADWFRNMWSRISAFFQKVFTKVLAAVKGDEALLKQLEEKAGKEGFQAKPYKGIGFTGAADAKKVANSLGTIANAAKSVKPSAGQFMVDTLAKYSPGGDNADSKTIGAVVSGIVLGSKGTIEVKTAGEALKTAKLLVGMGPNLKKAGTLAKDHASYSAKVLSTFQSAVSKGDEEATKKAKADVEAAKKVAGEISIVVSSLVSAYITAKNQALTIARSVIGGGSAAKAEEKKGEEKKEEKKEEATSEDAFFDFTFEDADVASEEKAEKADAEEKTEGEEEKTGDDAASEAVDDLVAEVESLEFA